MEYWSIGILGQRNFTIPNTRIFQYSNTPVRVLFVGGGSIGHIAPAIAVWEELRELRPDIRAHFVCSSKRADQQFLQKANVHFDVVDAPKLGVMWPLRFLQSYEQSLGIIKTFKPNIIFSKGGFVSVPVCLAAWRHGIPIVLHESDAVMGRANRLIGKLAEHVCLGFAATKNQNLKTHQPVTGNPVRRSVTQGSREEGLQKTGFSGRRPILLVMGGSQGAKALNDVIMERLDQILERVDVIHITGRGKKEERRGKMEVQQGYFSIEFAHEELPHFYATSAVALSRAGAGSIAELEACHVPAILVPLRGVGHDHQHLNAISACKQSDLFIHVEQSELSEKLIPTIRSLLQQERLSTVNSHQSTVVAARHIAQILLNTLEQTHRRQ